MLREHKPQKTVMYGRFSRFSDSANFMRENLRLRGNSPSVYLGLVSVSVERQIHSSMYDQTGMAE